MAYSKIVISSGHGKKVSGAVGYLNEVNEARRVVEKVVSYLKQIGATVYKFHDDSSTTPNTNLKTIVAYHNGKARELDVSIHFNAHKTTSSDMGVEVLYYNKKDLASKVSKAISDVSGLKNRGAKERKELYFLKNTSKPAILIEVCFVDSKADKLKYEKNFDKICKAIAEAITGKKVPASKPSTPAPTTGKVYRVIAGSFKEKTNAEAQVKSLKAKGFDAYISAEEGK